MTKCKIIPLLGKYFIVPIDKVKDFELDYIKMNYKDFNEKYKPKQKLSEIEIFIDETSN